MTNTSDNNIIAEFMGMKNTLNGWNDQSELLKDIELDTTFKTLKFDTDLGWLVLLIKRIDDLDVEEYKDAEGEEVFWEIPFRKLSEAEFETLYNKCLHFIKWWDDIDMNRFVV